ncbi:hypothetical protein ES707_10091 [subsurface metagenome]
MRCKRTRCLICQWESEASPRDGLPRTRIIQTVIDHFKKEHPKTSMMENIVIDEFEVQTSEQMPKET